MMMQRSLIFFVHSVVFFFYRQRVRVDIARLHLRALTTFMLFLVQGIYDVLICATLVWFVILSVLQKHFVHVRTSILEQFVGPVEDNQGNLTVA